MVAPPRYEERELTGRTRVRAGWRGRLVLQVEIGTTIYSACPPPPGRDPHEWREQMRRKGYTDLHWQDAHWDDIQALSGIDVLPSAIKTTRPWPRGPVNFNPRPNYPKPPAPPAPPPVSGRGQVPPRSCPPHPVPPMADTTFGGDAHFYEVDGNYPNCSRLSGFPC